MLKNILPVLVLVVIVGCSQEQQVANSSQSGTSETQVVAAQATPSEAPVELSLNLVFFLDPNGGPCKRQNTILQGMAEELKGKVNIRYVSTTVPDHKNLFYHYGIRALPTLLLSDASGKEIKRLPPGIKSVAAIRTFLQSIDKG